MNNRSSWGTSLYFRDRCRDINPQKKGLIKTYKLLLFSAKIKKSLINPFLIDSFSHCLLIREKIFLKIFPD